MNSIIFAVATWSTPVAGRTPTEKRTIPTRIAAAARMLAKWLPMSTSSTPSAQATSTLSQSDQLGERR